MQIEPVVCGEVALSVPCPCRWQPSGLAAAVNDDTSEEIYVDATLAMVLVGVTAPYSRPPRRAHGKKKKNLHLNSLKFSKLTH